MEIVATRKPEYKANFMRAAKVALPIAVGAGLLWAVTSEQHRSKAFEVLAVVSLTTTLYSFFKGEGL